MIPKVRFDVTTDVAKLTFDTEGGSLVRAEFLKHIDMANKSRNFVLLDDSKSGIYLAQTGVVAGTTGGSLPHPQNADDRHWPAHAGRWRERTGIAIHVARRGWHQAGEDLHDSPWRL